MSAEQILGLALALFVMGLGTIGAVLPGIPGTLLMPLAVIGHRLYFGDKGAAWWVIVLVVVLTAMTFVLDYLATVYGARKMGATWRGAVGAVLGGIIGLFFSLPGILLGPFVGAVALELTSGRGLKISSKAGLGATLGILAGAVGKLAICVAMMGLFGVNVVLRSAN